MCQSDEEIEENEEAAIQPFNLSTQSATQRRKSILVVRSRSSSKEEEPNILRRKSVSFIETNALTNQQDFVQLSTRRRSVSLRSDTYFTDHGVDHADNRLEGPVRSALKPFNSKDTLSRLQMAELKGTSVEIIRRVLNNAVKIVLNDMKGV